jgi:hypothetical protein
MYTAIREHQGVTPFLSEQKDCSPLLAFTVADQMQLFEKVRLNSWFTLAPTRLSGIDFFLFGNVVKMRNNIHPEGVKLSNDGCSVVSIAYNEHVIELPCTLPPGLKERFIRACLLSASWAFMLTNSFESVFTRVHTHSCAVLSCKQIYTRY